MATEYSTRPKEGVAERFYKYTFPCPMSGCWLWGGGVIKSENSQYGKISGKLAHRLSYEMHNGPIAAGMFVCHKCDTPLCVNPSHLFLGTHVDNMRDMCVKGRSDRSKFYATGRSPIRNTKITMQQAMEIRQYKRQSYRFIDMLAAKYGVSRSHIKHIRAGDSWAALAKVKDNTC